MKECLQNMLIVTNACLSGQKGNCQRDENRSENENESQAEKGQELIQEPAKEYICGGVF